MTEQPSTSVQRIDLAHAAAMPTPQGGALPTGLEWQALERMATMLADSNLIPYRLKKKPGDIAVILLAAREYGIPPIMALNKLPVINGTPAPMGELMVALVLRAGHYLAADFRNPDGTVYAGGPLTEQHYGEARYKRRDWTEREVMRFTIAEALTAGLIDRIDQQGRAVATVTKTRDGKTVEEPTPWQQYTPNMARWRAVANACRLNFPDVLLGLSYLPEELGAIVDAEGAPVEGEVIRPEAPSGTLEQRTAQEDADKLAEQPWPDHVVDAVRRKATEGGYVDVEVTYAGERMTLAEALTRHVADRRHADTVDAEIIEDPPAEGEAAPVAEEPSEAPSAPVQAEPVAQDPPAGETPQEGALDLAREVLICRDVELLRSYYRGAMEDGLATLDVLAVVDDSDLAVLGASSDLRELALGTLIVRTADYVGASGIAVRDPLPNFDEAPAPAVEDPWAADAAAGWPTSGDTPTT
jgi:hypothetical protein